MRSSAKNSLQFCKQHIAQINECGIQLLTNVKFKKMKQATDGRIRFLVLDSFRGLCAIFVVMYHISIANSIATHGFFRSSHLFVEIFFILSGFVLAHSYAFRDGLTFKKLIIPRAFRIFPLHLFVVAIMVEIECCKLYAQKRVPVSSCRIYR